MAQQRIQLDRDNFCCSICLDLLKDPVTIPCGHSYCMGCIKDCWDEEDQKNVHSCPQCRQTFTPRPVLVKNTMFAALVEDLKKTGLQAAPPDHCYAGPGDVACDICTGRKLKALKSCLVCLASYCERHLQRHYDAAPLKKHQLVNPCKTLQENICSRHNEVMKVFCRTDQQCICYLCSMEEHKDHDTVSAAAERNQRQKELGVSLQNIQQMIQNRERDMKVLQQRVEAINCSADKAVEHSEKIFTEVKQQIRSRQKAEVHQAEELQKKMEQKIVELRRKVTEGQQLSHAEDNVHFLQNSSSLSGLSESTDVPTDVRPPRCFEDVAVAVSEVRDKVEGILKEEGSKISLTVTEDVSLSRPEPKTRDEFLQYSRQITLDPNTAHTQLLLSEGNRKATTVETDQFYPHHRDRFIRCRQVLSREDLTGRCYWEVEWTGRVSIAVSHKNISRTGTSDKSGFGPNDKSWSLDCYNNYYEFTHNKIKTYAPGPQSSRVGVYLDHRAGVLSFYSVSGTMMTLLHRVQTSFTKTLYAGFSEMAQQGIQLDRDNFCCSICLDLLKDPVTIPCGHSYCMSCIKGCWDEEDQKNVHSCPQCRQTFTPRPVLVKNTMFAALVEDLKKTGLQAAPPDHCYAGPGDVACDVCTGRKLKALKSCLMCPASYCERHLQGHYDAAPLKKHQLVNPRKTLQENICSRHNEVMKVFCHTDQQCICYLCSMEEHKDHATVSAAAERNQRQKELGVSLQNIQQMIQDRERDMKVHQRRVEAINCSADKAVEHSEKIFTEVKQQIRSRQKAEVHQAEELQKKMEQKIVELRRKVTEVQQLSHTEDNVHFLQNSSSLSGLRESTDVPTDVRPPRCFEDVSVAVSEVRDKVEGILKEEGSKISLTVTEEVLMSRPEPKTRDEFLQYSRQITLDPNTANTCLLLSEGNRKATVVLTDQFYPHHPDRFSGWYQVLSREDLTGRCYWEVEWRGGVSIAVSHKNISRAGTFDECVFGRNDKSWSLDCYSNNYEFSHNKISTPAPGPQSSRVGVLDHRAGILSFYSVSGTMMTLLHRVQTSFTKTLYAGFRVDWFVRGGVELCELKSEMAQQGIQLDRDNFCCSICLDLLKDPVTIPCGHSYCMSCIKGCWDEEDQKNVHSCPQCRQIFTPRPVLVKNTMFAALVEDLKKTGLQAAPPDHCYAGPGDVACDVCTGRKLKALKSCLVCLASYCERHLQHHYDAAPLKKHQLVNPRKTLQENICSCHNEVMKVFCRTDQQCICYLCSMDEHKDHDTVSAAAERNQRQKELGVSLQNIQQMIQDRERDMKVLQRRVEAINCSADKAVEHSEKIFTEVKQQIRSRQKAEVHQAEELQKKMEQKIAELRRKVTEVQQLSHTEDNTHFLQNSSSLSGLSESTDVPTDVRPPRCFEDVSVAVSEVRDKVEGILKEEGSKISLTVTEEVLLSRPEPKTRDEFLQYSRQITLDPNTANTLVLLSEGNRKATAVRTHQLYLRHPDRFIRCRQVLSREDLTGRCYWEVEWTGSVSIAVSHKNISRTGTGDLCGFGHNDKSWSLDCYNNSYEFSHNKITTPAPGPQSSRVGVYLDHRAGVLSFYSVSGTMMTLLHRVQTSFTQTLCAGFGVDWC
ncbi:LOW QUALITY PROTEIN: uncharacterized protein ACN63O_006299 [Diretmus argenteus]